MARTLLASTIVGWSIAAFITEDRLSQSMVFGLGFVFCAALVLALMRDGEVAK